MAEQTLQAKFAGLNDMLVRVGKLEKTLVTLLQEVDKPKTLSGRQPPRSTQFVKEPRDTAAPPTSEPASEAEQANPAAPAPPYE